MRAVACFLPIALACCPSWAAGTPDAPSGRPVAKQPATGWAARAEKMAMAVMPQEKFDEAAGFFGPVAKKHLPAFNRFRREYEAASEKLPVVAKYMPVAEEAVVDARAMKVPAKYEAKKAEYLKMVDAFMAVLRMTLKVSGYPVNSYGKER